METIYSLCCQWVAAISDRHSSLYTQAKKNQPELEFERHEAVVSGIMSAREFSSLELSEQMGKVGHSLCGWLVVSSLPPVLPALLLCGLLAFILG